MTLAFYTTTIGRIGIAEENGSITRILFGTDAVPEDVAKGPSALTDEAARQVTAYLAGALHEFTLPLAPQGTAFLQTVWAALCRVPYGATASYKDIAVAVGNPKAVRAVGLANNRNPIPLIIPCHRIVGSNGKLTGYRGGLALKEQLLNLESRHGSAAVRAN